MSKEPSMEEILSSIKRIIAEEGEEAARAPLRGARRASGPAPMPVSEVLADVDDLDADGDEILELTDEIEAEAPMPAPIPEPVAAKPAPAKAKAVKPDPAPALAPTAEEPATRGSILSVESEVAARHSLSALSSMVVKPSDSSGDNTLDALVRSMLRPMLKEWLDANLPELVEAMVAKEIARITGRGI